VQRDAERGTGRRARVDAAAGELLGRHVARRPHHRAFARERRRQRRPPVLGLDPVDARRPPRRRRSRLTSTRPSLPTRTLSGLKSRCTSPSACAATSPRPAARKTATTSRQGRAERSQPPSEPPSTEFHGDEDLPAKVPILVERVMDVRDVVEILAMALRTSRKRRAVRQLDAARPVREGWSGMLRSLYGRPLRSEVRAVVARRGRWPMHAATQFSCRGPMKRPLSGPLGGHRRPPAPSLRRFIPCHVPPGPGLHLGSPSGVLDHRCRVREAHEHGELATVWKPAARQSIGRCSSDRISMVPSSLRPAVDVQLVGRLSNRRK
jgi:hypothetical protein